VPEFSQTTAVAVDFDLHAPCQMCYLSAIISTTYSMNYNDWKYNKHCEDLLATKPDSKFYF